MFRREADPPPFIRAEKQAAKMTAAFVWLRKNGVHYEHVGPHHIRIGDINFYPTTGKIYLPNTAQGYGGGLPALGILLRERGYIKIMPPITPDPEIANDR